MATIARASAYANNEVAYLAWALDGELADCLGFHIVREYLDAADAVIEVLQGLEPTDLPRASL